MDKYNRDNFTQQFVSSDSVDAYSLEEQEYSGDFGFMDQYNDSPLVKGIIWAEILGPPVSKRKGRGRHGF